MKIGITGATGFIARHLIAALRMRGHDPVAYARSSGRPVSGCVETRPLPSEAPPDISGLDAIVNLAGENIVGLWTSAKRRRIHESRVGTTRRLVTALCTAPGAPRILVNASATGFYGSQGDSMLAEGSSSGSGFLADVCRDWEAQARAAETAGVRVAWVRIGFVMGQDGGAFPLLRRAFRLGLGGRLGAGRQWMPPVHVDDVAALFVHLLETSEASGAYNAVCPAPVRNVDFTRQVAQALHRPAIVPVPAIILRTMLGELSHLLLDSTRALPERTIASGFSFRFPTLGAMLDDICR